MKIIKLKDLSTKEYKRIINRSIGGFQEILPTVRLIMEKIKKEGDRSIYQKYRNRYGKNNYQTIAVTRKEIKEAYKYVSRDFLKALKQMKRNISLVHQAQPSKKKETAVTPISGIKVWRLWRPIEKVGLYIPGGKSVYPSSVLMTAIPAKIAGCNEIIMCSPPKEDGRIPAATLVASDFIGLNKIYKVGGPEAIAAMTYGTETIPKVYKIFGAGNSYVTAAKMFALNEVAIDMPAGPSEVFIIADDIANPSYIAADLLADGEHGPDSACVLLTTSKNIAEGVLEHLEKQLQDLKTVSFARKSLDKYGLIALVDSIDEAVGFTNEYAPEHLEIMTKNPKRIVKKIKNAGSVFLGDYTSKSSGDYATGANHVLPTGGAAKMYPPLGVDSFGKWMQVQECTKEGLSRIRKTIEIIAEIEQLPAHKNATSIRFNSSREI